MARPHGLTGEVVVDLVTDRRERLATGSVLTAADRRLTVAASRAFGKRWLVRFAEVGDRASAEAIRGLALSAPPLDLPGVLWVHQLVGAQVVDQTGEVLGTVEAVESNPAADLLVLEGGGLVPLNFVVSFEPGHRVVVDPPEGLLG